MTVKISQKRAVNSLLNQMDTKVIPTFSSTPRILHLSDYDPDNRILDGLELLDQIDAMVVSISQSLDLTLDFICSLTEHCERLGIPELIINNHNPIVDQSDLNTDLKVKVRLLYNEAFSIEGLKCFMLSTESKLYKSRENIDVAGVEVVFGLNPPLNALDDFGDILKGKMHGCPRLAEWLRMLPVRAYCSGGTGNKKDNDNYIKLSGIHYFNSTRDYQIIDFDTINKIDRFSDVFKAFRY